MRGHGEPPGRAIGRVMTVRPTLADDEIGTYFAAAEWLIGVIAHPDMDGAWNRPSALARYSTGGVAAHAVFAGLVRLVQLLGEPEPEEIRPVEVTDYFAPNRLESPEDDDPLFVILREGAGKTARRGRDALVSTARAAADELHRVLPATLSNRRVAVARIEGGTTTVSGYLRTRILEVVVHGDDLVASVGDPSIPPAPPAAIDVCVHLCVELARASAGDMAVLRALTPPSAPTRGRSGCWQDVCRDVRRAPCVRSSGGRASGRSC